VFGYVKVYAPELKLREMEAYKAVYCGLCRELGKRFGFTARITLSYDFTFLAMIGMALADERPEIKKGRCFVNPFRKVSYADSNPVLSRCCDIAIISLHYKAADDIEDSGFFGRLAARFLMLLYSRAYRKAKEAEPQAEKAFSLLLEAQDKIEKGECAVIDAACEPTAHALGEVFALFSQDPQEQRVLRRLGYLMGRYIYMADAIDDLQKDKKTGSYNPFLVNKSAEATQDNLAQASIYMTIGEISTAYALLSLKRFSPILDNIVYLGIKNTADELIQKTKTAEAPDSTAKGDLNT